MNLNMDSIKFESRREIEKVMIALTEWLEKNPKKDDGTVRELVDKLDAMHMNW